MPRSALLAALLLAGCFSAVPDQPTGISGGTAAGTQAGTGTTATQAVTSSLSSSGTGSGASGSTASSGSAGSSGVGLSASASSSGSGSLSSAGSSSGSTTGGQTTGSTGTGSTGGSDFNTSATTGYSSWQGIKTCSDDTSDTLFQPPESFPVDPSGYLIEGLGLADVDGDGRLDVVAATQTGIGGTVTALRNLGDGLGPLSSISVPLYPSSLQLADVNGDGHPDVLVGGEAPGGTGGGAVAVLVNDGTGQWIGPSTYAVDSQAPVFALADLDGDTYPELIAAGDASPSLSVFPNHRDGTFGTPAAYPASMNASALTIADVNGDQTPDAVVAMPTAGVALLLGDGRGGFQPPQTLVTASSGDPVIRARVGDVNGDGRPDVVAVRAHEIAVSLDSAAGTFTASAQPLDAPPSDALLADMDGDHRADLVLFGTAGNASWVSVWRASASGGFTPGATYPLCSAPVQARIADVNGDGHPDILFTYADHADLGVALGDGRGRLTVSDAFSNIEFDVFSVGDLDGDGKADVLTGSRDDGQVNLLLAR